MRIFLLFLCFFVFFSSVFHICFDARPVVYFGPIITRGSVGRSTWRGRFARTYVMSLTVLVLVSVTVEVGRCPGRLHTYIQLFTTAVVSFSYSSLLLPNSSSFPYDVWLVLPPPSRVSFTSTISCLLSLPPACLLYVPISVSSRNVCPSVSSMSSLVSASASFLSLSSLCSSATIVT